MHSLRPSAPMMQQSVGNSFGNYNCHTVISIDKSLSTLHLPLFKYPRQMQVRKKMLRRGFC